MHAYLHMRGEKRKFHWKVERQDIALKVGNPGKLCVWLEKKVK